MGFTKLDDGLAQSSIVTEDDAVFKVWILILSLTGSDGLARVSSSFLASVTRKTDDEIARCLSVLESPDRNSRSQVEDGRRILRVDGGYQVVNHGKYRAFSYSQEPEAVRKRAYRAGHSGTCPGRSASASASASVSVIQEGESEREIQPKLPITPSATKMSKGKESKDEKLREVVGAMKSVFDRVFDRTAPLQEKTIRKAVERLRSGEVLPWKLVALPIMVEAQGIKPEIRSRLNLSMLLRDGKHPRSHPTYGTVGATDWVYETYERSDKTRLDQRLSDLARAADKICPGLLSGLKRYNVSIMDPRVDDEAF